MPLSRATFDASFGSRPAAKLIKRCPRNGEGEALLPDWNKLLPGDVIMSSKRAKKRSPLKDQVYRVQRQHGYAEDIARFTHAMIYVGHLHVAESQTFFWADGRLPMTGNRIAPLTLYAPDHDLVVCRHPNLTADQRNLIAIDSLLNVSIDRKPYDFYRAIAEGDRRAFALLRRFLPRRSRDEREAAAICSDFVLECHIRQGLMLTEYIRTKEDQDFFFYPAEFIASGRFNTFDLPLDRAVKIQF